MYLKKRYLKFSCNTICFSFVDLENKLYILKNGGVALLYECLLVEDEAVVISAITTLMFLVTPESKSGECDLMALSIEFPSLHTYLPFYTSD